MKPDKPIVDYRTDITGITAEDIEKATLSVADVQVPCRVVLSVYFPSNNIVVGLLIL